MTAAEAGEDRELSGEPEPDPMAGGSLPPLGVCFVSLLRSTDPRHVLLPEALTGASDNVVLEESQSSSRVLFWLDFSSTSRVASSFHVSGLRKQFSSEGAA